MNLLLFLFFILTSSLTTIVFAQKAEDLLPDINPQDIEIRSEYRARFPGLRRQPILGFDTKPAIYQLDPNRMPFLETSDEVVASVPISTLIVPLEPQRTWLNSYPSNLINMGLGYGTYNTPEGWFWFNQKEGDSRFYGMVDFLHSENQSRVQSNQFTDVLATAGLHKTLLNRTNLDISTDLVYRNLYTPTNSTTSTQKELFSTSLNGRFYKKNNLYQKWSLEFNSRYSSFTDSFHSNTNRNGFNELISSAQYTLEKPASTSNSSWIYQLDIKTGFYNFNSQNWLLLIPLVSYKSRNHFLYRYEAGIQPVYQSDQAVGGFLLYPKAEFEYWGISNSVITVSILPEVSNEGAYGWSNYNSFLDNTTLYLNNRGISFHGRYQYSFSSRKAIYGGFKQSLFTKKGYVDYIPVNPSDSRHILNYDKLSITKLFAGYESHLVSDKLTLKAEGYYQAHNPEDSQSIPFIESTGIYASVYYRFNTNWYFLSWTDINLGRSQNKGSADIFLLNLKTEYRLNDFFSLYLKGYNLTNQDYKLWADYSETPLLLIGGCTLTL